MIPNQVQALALQASYKTWNGKWKWKRNEEMKWGNEISS